MNAPASLRAALLDGQWFRNGINYAAYFRLDHFALVTYDCVLSVSMFFLPHSLAVPNGTRNTFVLMDVHDVVACFAIARLQWV